MMCSYLTHTIRNSLHVGGLPERLVEGCHVSHLTTLRADAAPQDVVTRYAHMNGFRVERKWGWDCHGLPVEFEIDQKLGIKSRDDVMAMGIKAYNAECRSVVMRYADEWKRVVRRMARLGSLPSPRSNSPLLLCLLCFIPCISRCRPRQWAGDVFGLRGLTQGALLRVCRWIDMENDYKTLDINYMESVWWVCKQLFEKDLIYRGYKVSDFSSISD